MAITAAAVKELRERTGAGMMDCKRALEETDGDMDKAVAQLREKGLARGEEVRARRPRGPRLQLYPHRWPRRRADRGQLRDGLRRPHGRVPASSCATSRCRSPASPRCTSTSTASPRRSSLAKKAALPPTSRSRAKPEAIREKIVGGPAGQVVQGGLPARAALPRRGPHRARSGDRAIATIGENILVRRFTRYALGEEM